MSRPIGRSQQAGYSVIELFIFLLILGVLFTIILNSFSEARKWELYTSRLNRLAEIAHYFQSNVQDDVAMSGLGTAQNPDRLLVKDVSTSKPRPSVFLDDQNNLVILHTANEGAGEIFVLADGTMQLVDVDFDTWSQVRPGQTALCLNPKTGDPASLIRITSTPRKGTDSDFTSDTEVVNLDRTAVFTFEPASQCFGVAPLSTVVAVGGVCVPVSNCIRYGNSKQGLLREEFWDCSDKPLRPGTDPNQSRNQLALAPQMQAETKFSYLTTTGTASSFPADPSTLLGINVLFKVVDPNSQLSQEVAFNVFVESWKK